MRDKILFYSFSLLLISLFGGIFFLSVGLITFSVLGMGVSIIGLYKKERKIKYTNWGIAVMAYPILVLLSDSIMNGSQLQSIIKIADIYYLFLLFPFIYMCNESFFIQKVNQFLKIYFISACISLVYLLSLSFYKGIIQTHFHIDYWYFSYSVLASNVGAHPIYLSILYAFAVFIGIYTYKEESKYGLIQLVFTIALFIVLLLLSSRTTLFACSIGAGIICLKKWGLSKRVLSVVIGILGLFVLMIWFNPVMQKRYNNVVQGNELFSGLSFRVDLWETAYDVAKKSPVIGIGRSNVQKELNQEYRKRDMFIPFREGYHAHNQYLQSYLYAGVLGIVFLLLPMFFLLVYWIQNRRVDVFALSFLLLFLISCMTESVYERVNGRAFFIVAMILVFSHLKNNINENRSFRNKGNTE